MPDVDFTIRQNDTSSAITATLKDASGVAVNIQAASVRFKMYPVAGGTAKVDAVASNNQVGDGSDGSKGKVSYSWSGTDTDTAGFYLGSWKVTFGGGAIQTFPNSGYVLIYVSPPAQVSLGHDYVTLEELKKTTEMTSTTFADDDLRIAISAASGAIDKACRRRFWSDADATGVRYYTPSSRRYLLINDLITLTSLLLDETGSGTFGTTWTNGTEFVLEPANASADGKPWEIVRVRAYSGTWLPVGIEHSVKVTGKFGWASVPPEIKMATKILAVKLTKRVREAPFAIVTAGIESAVAIRVAKSDPDVSALILDFVRVEPF